MNKTDFSSLKDLLKHHQPSQINTSIAHEHQDYGMKLAHELGDLKRKSLYIKLARDKDRGILERVRSFVKDANAKSPPRLFMWKLKQLEGKSR